MRNVILALLFACSVANATETDPSCSKWLASKRDGYEEGYYLGYLAAMNVSYNQQQQVPDVMHLGSERLRFMMDSYCRENPSGTVSRGVKQMLDNMVKFQQKSSPKRRSP